MRVSLVTIAACWGRRRRPHEAHMHHAGGARPARLVPRDRSQQAHLHACHCLTTAGHRHGCMVAGA